MGDQIKTQCPACKDQGSESLWCPVCALDRADEALANAKAKAASGELSGGLICLIQAVQAMGVAVTSVQPEDKQ